MYIFFVNVKVAMKKVTNSAYKQYVRSRPAPSAESFKRVKSILEGPLDVHPLFGKTLFLKNQLLFKIPNII